MELNEITVSKAIIEKYSERLIKCLENDVVIVGAGPSGLVAGYYLAKEGLKTCIFERRLALGGGLWGGGMLFNFIVIQEEGKKILDEFGIPSEKYTEGYYIADAIDTVAILTAKAKLAGTTIFTGITVEDIVLKNERVKGVVINWSAVEIANFHVDPLTIFAKYVIDATGHEASVTNVLQKKAGVKLNTATGTILGEKPMWAEVAEKTILENTKEVYPGLYVAGMAANAVYGSYRMGPIFGGMLLSGQKVAQIIIQRCRENKKT